VSCGFRWNIRIFRLYKYVLTLLSGDTEVARPPPAKCRTLGFEKKVRRSVAVKFPLEIVHWSRPNNSVTFNGAKQIGVWIIRARPCRLYRQHEHIFSTVRSETKLKNIRFIRFLRRPRTVLWNLKPFVKVPNSRGPVRAVKVQFRKEREKLFYFLVGFFTTLRPPRPWW